MDFGLLPAGRQSYQLSFSADSRHRWLVYAPDLRHHDDATACDDDGCHFVLGPVRLTRQDNSP